MSLYPYRESKQFERYIGQFMRVFSGFQVPTGRNSGQDIKRIPVVYGAMDRVVASILNNRETFTNHKLPIIACVMTGLTIDENNKAPNKHRDYIGSRGYGDGTVTERIMGLPLIMNMDVSIYASSSTEMFLILEQILLIFNPRVTIQIDSSANNADYLTDIILEGIQPEIDYPMGGNNRTVMLTLNFSIPVRLSYPRGKNSNYIDTVKQNILNTSSESIDDSWLYTELDETGIKPNE